MPIHQHVQHAALPHHDADVRRRARDADEDAVAIANDSPYGLAGGVWSASTERAMGVARRLRTGQVDVNGGRFNPLAPFGGYKQSGIGREIGPLALDEFFVLKAIQR